VLKGLLVTRRVVVAKRALERSVADALAVARNTSELLAVPGLVEDPHPLDHGMAVGVHAGGVLAGGVLK
jgi:hypothetical protein